MSTDPEQIRSDIEELLAGLPDVTVGDVEPADIEAVAVRLEQAHDLLVRALESVEGRGDAIAEN
ncbi:uncharacterized protein RMCC_5719 [Mycolicibacterium canariasense]|uniref:Uncharacterized protein n=1 Tax=Mycolicibacterium canariasense TaxID=228230 RepID=A0A100WIY9_MYCCR|nr:MULTISPECIES: hypothetical protein [Mycolicibacterium]MCV7210795.1 hypothetical protein [Mycolicibacterium canariasense]MCX2715168.1 hypothetical protein [Mycolicibacterium sp. J2]ORV10806.1 hypothetical protein AWB94_06325 [Mycolicibacterium canariasense]GAS98754.1 uncharacterized protein RMCC_5719 [Mycolicibacterium canariasense]